MTAVLHIAGLDAQVGSRLRQRCAWCGALLIDYELSGLAVPVGQEGRVGVWPFGKLVLLDGALSVLVEYDAVSPLPDGACAKLDPEVTR